MKYLSEKMMATEEIDDPLVPLILKDGFRDWRDEEGRTHREGWPALVSKDGKTQYWYKHGFLHRAGGPAFETPISKGWAIDGKYHREDGPAIIYTLGDGTRIEFWYLNGVLTDRNIVRNLGETK